MKKLIILLTIFILAAQSVDLMAGMESPSDMAFKDLVLNSPMVVLAQKAEPFIKNEKKGNFIKTTYYFKVLKILHVNPPIRKYTLMEGEVIEVAPAQHLGYRPSVSLDKLQSVIIFLDYAQGRTYRFYTGDSYESPDKIGEIEKIVRNK